MYQPISKASDSSSQQTAPVITQFYQYQQQESYQSRHSSTFVQVAPSRSTAPPLRSYSSTNSASSPYTVHYALPPPRYSAFTRYMLRLWRALLLVALSVVSMFSSIGTFAIFMVFMTMAGGWFSTVCAIFFVVNLVICFIGPLTKLDAYISRQRQLMHHVVLADTVDIFADCCAA
ncbi:hypothetical protein AeMF1_005934 [Aphanomyces euteiches]|nr:hypothetical protein AeMF1_005934 [Aphanomyces euteiches]KAH9181844.1 hypothetical protein AeNC1_016179 [Aphanomyces euteiches]